MDETVKEASVKALTAGQRALWILSRLAPESSAYQTSRAIRVRGTLDSRKLLRVYERLSIAKPSLRTELVERDGAPLLSLNASANIRAETLDVTGWSELELAERINQEANRPFELGGEPLFRILLLRRADDDTVLVATAHQLLLDPDSYFAVLEELLSGYGNEEKLWTEANEPELQPDRVDRRDEDAARAYWLQKLSGTLPVLHLPADKPRPPVRTFGGSDLSFRIPDGLAQSLRKAAANERLELQELLLAAYQVLLHRYSNQDDVLVGVFLPPHDDAQEASIGSYANPVVVRSDLSEDTAFADFFRKTGTALAEAYERRGFPFPQLVELLQPDRDPSFPALFQASYSYRKQQGRYAAGFGALAFENEGKEFDFADGLTFESIRLARKEVQYDLRLSVIDDGEAAIGRFDYYSDLFEAGTIERLKDNFLTLLESIALQPEEQAKRLNLLAEGERELLLGDWSGEAKAFPEVAIHSLFEERAALHPDKEAVVFGEERWTYRELNERANRLAHYLRKNGVVPDTLVGVFLERTLDIPVVLFAILKAGGAYVPLDPHYPKDRIAVTLEDSRAPIIVTRSDLASLLPADYEGKIVRYDEEQDVISRNRRSIRREGRSRAIWLTSSTRRARPDGRRA
ncbi:condensation domain-containing protein [Cohnella faecalis]|uniref:Non-ribosomal peptide synthetase n=1 Tax=Cohnella faecalis TaxID=2315694 RepID=A0A398CPJ6_9BACL|nr:condensation domain-containing protein [Cohnella faecalis]RIE03249.1 hypothetical protein D3H35_12810 [Cohnella faecalis]